MCPDVRGCRQTTHIGLRGPRTFKGALGAHPLVPPHPHAYLLALPTWPSLGFAPFTSAPLGNQIPTPVVQGCSPRPVQERRGDSPSAVRPPSCPHSVAFCSHWRSSPTTQPHPLLHLPAALSARSERSASTHPAPSLHRGVPPASCFLIASQSTPSGNLLGSPFCPGF